MNKETDHEDALYVEASSPTVTFLQAIHDLAHAKVTARLHSLALRPDWSRPLRHEAASSRKTMSTGRIRGLCRKGLRALLPIRRRWATIRFLEQLDDDVLKDIGLHRSEIRSIADEPDDRLPRLRLDL